MGLFEILLLVLGTLFLVLSFFIGNEKENRLTESGTEILSKEDKENLIRQVKDSVEETADNAVEDARNRLASISNEIILSVDDFTKQTLERINHNHEEVVFMYNMLQKKEEELKRTMEELNKVSTSLDEKKADLKDFTISMAIPEESGIEMARKRSRALKKDSSFETAKKASTESKATTAPTVISEIKTEKKKQSKAPQTKDNINFAVVEIPEGDENNKTAKVLELYREKKSVLEISKLLGLGQGEVKLVIDLYAKN